MSARDALERWIACQLPACTHDELRVIGIRMERMAKARPEYGGLVIAADARDWKREAAEENVDRAFYADCLYIAKQDEERERIADDELVDTRLRSALTGGG